MINILIIYYTYEIPLRATIKDDLYSYERFSEARCFYFNAALRELPDYLVQTPFDLIIFHSTFLWYRVDYSWRFVHLMRKLEAIRHMKGVKVVLPQDEHVGGDALNEFIQKFGVQRIFSVAPPSEWPKIYPNLERDQIAIDQVLTGYLDQNTLERINRLTQNAPPRSIDIGYRARREGPALGRHGLLKGQIADLFLTHAQRRNLTLDISTRPDDAFIGDSWYEFLLRCKYTIGVEGGASLEDRSGTLRWQIYDYLKQHPEASFEEIESAFFPGQEGRLQYVAISPRHLEACATHTCQVLVAGRYNEILKPGVHYIELQKDFSNIEVVLDLIEKDHLRQAMVEQAYQDVVVSERYTYPSFVRFVLSQSLPGHPIVDPLSASPAVTAAYNLNRQAEEAAWRIVNREVSKLNLKIRLRKKIIRVIPEERFMQMMAWLRKAAGKTA